MSFTFFHEKQIASMQSDQLCVFELYIVYIYRRKKINKFLINVMLFNVSPLSHITSTILYCGDSGVSIMKNWKLMVDFGEDINNLRFVSLELRQSSNPWHQFLGYTLAMLKTIASAYPRKCLVATYNSTTTH